MSHGLTRTARTGSLALLLVALPVFAFQQPKTFIPVEGANLKVKIENAIVAGRMHSVNGRFWVAYQFEVRPSVSIDFDVLESVNGVYTDIYNATITSDALSETRELGYFMTY